MWPITRSVLVVAAHIFVAAVIGLIAGDIDWFLAALIVQLPLLWAMDKLLWSERRKEEKRAANRLFGLPDD